jgi:hypothetical protein
MRRTRSVMGRSRKTISAQTARVNMTGSGLVVLAFSFSPVRGATMRGTLEREVAGWKRTYSTIVMLGEGRASMPLLA